MGHQRVTRTVAMLCTVVFLTTLMSGCSDDDGADDSAAGDLTTTTTSPPETEQEPEQDPDVTAVTEDLDDEPAEPGLPTALLDLVDGSVAGYQLGEPADPVVDRLVELLGPPESDTGWQPTECPPAAEARSVAWSGFFVYFGYLDEQVLDGARFDLAEVDLDEVPPVRFPDGVEWGAPIDEVASAVDATAIYDEAFGWWEILVAAPDVAVQYLAGPQAVLDQVMLGYVPVCR